MATDSKYEREAARLAKLPRAQRLQQLVDFPAEFTFKAIGHGATFGDEVRAALDGCGRQQVILVERPSAKGRYRSITFSITAQDGTELDEIYGVLQRLPNLVYLL